MAQIIRHRRGSLEALSAATSSFQKGELIIVSGSSNITASNGSGMVFAAVESGSIQAVNRFIVGNNAPNVFPAGTYNGLVKGVPYYASGSSTLYLLGSDGNDIPDLTGNISNFSASVSTSISALSASIGSGTIGNSVTLLSSKTGSYATTGSNTFDGSQTINNGELIIQSGSNPQIRLINDTTDIQYHIQNGNGGNFQIHREIDGDDKLLFLFESSSADEGYQDARFFGNLIVSKSIDTFRVYTSELTGSLSGSVNGIGNVTEFSTSVDSRFSASVASVTSLSASVASVTGDFSSSVATSFSQSNASITSLSASVASVTGDFSSSVATSFSASAYNVSASNASQDIRIDQLASFTGSYATTGSNIFFGTQTFTGSVYITQDLIVQGSSSLQNVTASAVSIGTNQINLNTDFPAFRYAGLNVYDSGSSGVSASLQWDSLTDQWIFVHKESGSATVDSSILLYGPLSTGGLGSETGLTSNYLTKVEDNGHGHHLTTSSIEDTGTKVTVHNSLDVTGEISASTINGIGNVTAYSQSVSASLAEITANVGSGVGVSITNLNSFSSSTLGRLDNIESFSSSVETKLTEIGVVSGSLIASASTAKTTNDTQDGRLTNLEATSASVNTSVSNLNSTTASLNTSVSALNSSSESQQISIDALNTFSGSTLGRLTNLESTSASVNTSVSNLNTFSGSSLIRFTNLESTSASVNDSIAALNSYTSSNTSTTALNAHTASANERFTEIGVVSGSLISSASAAKTTNDSQDVSISNLNTFSGSQLTQNSTLATYTGSVETRLTEIGVVSGSLIASASAAKITNDSQDVSITNINSFTQSFSQSVATDFSASDARLDVIEDSLGSGGSIGTRVTALETSSVNLNTFSASVLTQLTEIGVVSGSLISSASAAKTTNDSQDISISNLNTFSGSSLTRLSNLESTSASLNTSVSNLNTFSASVNTSITNINSTTASLNTSVATLNSYSSSLKSAFELTGSNVVVLGDFTVRGTQTIVDSTTIQIGDNIIELNGTGATNGGLYVKDATAPNTETGSLLWDSTNDYWKAGVKDSEYKILLANGDSVVSGSSQITISSTTGFDTFSGSISTDFSASNASITSLSASVASVTGDFSSSVATSFSASNASITALSASVASVTGDFSSSVATSFSASAASQLSLSSSFATSQGVQDTRLGLLETSTGSLNLFTSSIDTTIKTKLDAETVVSGSSQIDITATTGFTTFSASIETRISLIDGGTY
jgi:hypothetical protein